jgi:hypothetical protein
VGEMKTGIDRKQDGSLSGRGEVKDEITNPQLEKEKKQWLPLVGGGALLEGVRGLLGLLDVGTLRAGDLQSGEKEKK